MKSSSLFTSLIAAASAAALLLTTARACDLCAVYCPPCDHATGSDFLFHFSLAERFTHYGTLQENGHEIGNPLDQHLDSSITQFVIGGSFFDHRLGVQLNLPYIYRSYARAGHFITEHGDEEGFGDMTLLASYELFRFGDKPEEQPAAPSAKGAKNVVPGTVAVEPRNSGSFRVKAGLKAPTGDSGRIAEELHEHEHEGFAASGIHGHDLALGSGSWDGIVGAEFFFRHDRLFFTGDVQYAIRTSGDYGYEYANDLLWEFGPGVYLLRDGSRTVALQALVSGEDKGFDTMRGEIADDTAITSWFVGPRITATFGRVALEAGVDLPVSLKNSEIQAVPDYRIHAGVTVRF